jgi:hypothetical protein
MLPLRCCGRDGVLGRFDRDRLMSGQAQEHVVETGLADGEGGWDEG